MKFLFDHTNINVADLDRSIAFYTEALGLTLTRKKVQEGSFTLAFMTDEAGRYQLELTWLQDHEGAYDLGENETHLCFTTDDYDAAHAKHDSMGCICFENPGMGLYFIEDPDGYWIEIVPARR